MTDRDPPERAAVDTLPDRSDAGDQTVHLLVEHGENRRILADWLGETYDARTSREAALTGAVDLCVVDTDGFAAHREALRDWKEAEHPRFAPVVLAAEDHLSERFEPAAWDDIDGLYIVDELVEVPVEKAVLHRRLDNLLRRRSLSRHLSRARERSEERFSTLFHATPDPSLVLAPDGTVRYANDALCDLLGLDREETVGRALASLEPLSPETAGTIRTAAEAATDGEPAETREVTLQTPAGHLHRAEVNAGGISLPEGGGATVVLRDVTERVERERKLAESERRFRALFDSTNDAMMIADDDGYYTEVNDAALDLYEMDREELLGRRVGEFAPEDYDFEAVWEQFLADGEMTGEFELVRSDGETRILEFSATTDVRPGEHLSALRDVTDQREQQRRLAEIQDRFRQIADHVTEVIWMVDAEGEEGLYVSPGVEDLTGLGPEALASDPVETALTAVHPEDRDRVEAWMEELFADVAAGAARDRYSVEARVEGPAGQRWVEIDGYPVRPDGEVTRVVGLIDDITERRERERELERQNDRLEDFASVVSHDLRNPLQIITSRAELLENDENAASIREAAGRMESLIDDLLTLAKHGDSRQAVSTVALEQVTASAWTLVEAPESTLSVPASGTVVADETRLQQLFENLFRNAVEHAGPGVTVTVGACEGGFYVADDGPGIPAADRDSVFDMGFSTAREGTGFGLPIVQDVVQAHGWDVAVTESAAGGARFEITGVDVSAADR